MVNYQQAVASALLEIGAVKFQPNTPFTWASGLKSPIYTDNRQTISYPEVRDTIANGLAALIREKYPEANVIGGVATAGIPHAAWVAQVMNLPMVYVRSKPKDHGSGNQIEGRVDGDSHVVLIDDLISTGGSVLGAVDAVRKAGAQVDGVVSIFSYELPAADENFAAANTAFAPLTTYSELVAAAGEQGQLTAEEMQTLTEWRKNPSAWSDAHQG
jgi:orotate phosphoribosyltransferase